MEAELRDERPTEDPPGILLALLTTVRCLESAHDLLLAANFKLDAKGRAREARHVLRGLRRIRDSFAHKFEAHPEHPRHFKVAEPLPGPGVERLRAVGIH